MAYSLLSQMEKWLMWIRILNQKYNQKASVALQQTSVVEVKKRKLNKLV